MNLEEHEDKEEEGKKQHSISMGAGQTRENNAEYEAYNLSHNEL